MPRVQGLGANLEIWNEPDFIKPEPNLSFISRAGQARTRLSLLNLFIEPTLSPTKFWEVANKTTLKSQYASLKQIVENK